MTNERKLEIAMAMLGYIMRMNNVRLTEDTLRDLGNMARAMGISIEEVMELIEPLVR